jgi:hypothetical protein
MQQLLGYGVNGERFVLYICQLLLAVKQYVAPPFRSDRIRFIISIVRCNEMHPTGLSISASIGQYKGWLDTWVPP